MLAMLPAPAQAPTDPRPRQVSTCPVCKAVLAGLLAECSATAACLAEYADDDRAFAFRARLK